MSQPLQGYGRAQQQYNPQPSSYEQKPYGDFENKTTSNTYYTHQRADRDEDFLPPNDPSNPLSVYLAQLLERVEDLCNEVSHQLYTNSTVIVIAAGLAGGVHYFASQKSPLANAALDATFHGTVAVAKYVGLSFFIKTALTPIHERCTHEIESGFSRTKDRINSHVVSYLTPMALAWIVAYSQGIPVKLGTATLYTMGTFGLMKLLNMGYDYALAKYEERRER